MQVLISGLFAQIIVAINYNQNVPIYLNHKLDGVTVAVDTSRPNIFQVTNTNNLETVGMKPIVINGKKVEGLPNYYVEKNEFLNKFVESSDCDPVCSVTTNPPITNIIRPLEDAAIDAGKFDLKDKVTIFDEHFPIYLKYDDGKDSFYLNESGLFSKDGKEWVNNIPGKHQDLVQTLMTLHFSRDKSLEEWIAEIGNRVYANVEDRAADIYSVLSSNINSRSMDASLSQSPPAQSTSIPSLHQNTSSKQQSPLETSISTSPIGIQNPLGPESSQNLSQVQPPLFSESSRNTPLIPRIAPPTSGAANSFLGQSSPMGVPSWPQPVVGEIPARSVNPAFYGNDNRRVVANGITYSNGILTVSTNGKQFQFSNEGWKLPFMNRFKNTPFFDNEVATLVSSHYQKIFGRRLSTDKLHDEIDPLALSFLPNDNQWKFDYDGGSIYFDDKGERIRKVMKGEPEVELHYLQNTILLKRKGYQPFTVFPGITLEQVPPAYKEAASDYYQDFYGEYMEDSRDDTNPIITSMESPATVEQEPVESPDVSNPPVPDIEMPRTVPEPKKGPEPDISSKSDDKRPESKVNGLELPEGITYANGILTISDGDRVFEFSNSGWKTPTMSQFKDTPFYGHQFAKKLGPYYQRIFGKKLRSAKLHQEIEPLKLKYLEDVNEWEFTYDKGRIYFDDKGERKRKILNGETEVEFNFSESRVFLRRANESTVVLTKNTVLENIPKSYRDVARGTYEEFFGRPIRSQAVDVQPPVTNDPAAIICKEFDARPAHISKEIIELILDNNKSYKCVTNYLTALKKKTAGSQFRLKSLEALFKDYADHLKKSNLQDYEKMNRLGNIASDFLKNYRSIITYSKNPTRGFDCTGYIRALYELLFPSSRWVQSCEAFGTALWNGFIRDNHVDVIKDCMPCKGNSRKCTDNSCRGTAQYAAYLKANARPGDFLLRTTRPGGHILMVTEQNGILYVVDSSTDHHPDGINKITLDEWLEDHAKRDRTRPFKLIRPFTSRGDIK